MITLCLLDEPIGVVDPAARDYILRTIIGNYSGTAADVFSIAFRAGMAVLLFFFSCRMMKKHVNLT